jgi:hypothetical protein
MTIVSQNVLNSDRHGTVKPISSAKLKQFRYKLSRGTYKAMLKLVPREDGTETCIGGSTGNSGSQFRLKFSSFNDWGSPGLPGSFSLATKV